MIYTNIFTSWKLVGMKRNSFTRSWWAWSCILWTHKLMDFIYYALFFIWCFASYLWTFVSGWTSSLAVWLMMLVWIPPQITKATYQIWLLWWWISGMRNFLHSWHIPWKYITGSVVATFFGWWIGWTFMTLTPNSVLQKATWIFFLIFLCITYLRRNLKNSEVYVTRLREYFVYFWQFLLSILSWFIPGAAGPLYFILYTRWIWIKTLEYKALWRCTALAGSIGTFYPIYHAGLIDLRYVIPFFVWMYLGWHLWTKHIINIWESIATKIVYLSIFFLAIYLIFSQK